MSKVPVVGSQRKRPIENNINTGVKAIDLADSLKLTLHQGLLRLSVISPSPFIMGYRQDSHNIQADSSNLSKTTIIQPSPTP